jgi:hypothetical protein
MVLRMLAIPAIRAIRLNHGREKTIRFQRSRGVLIDNGRARMVATFCFVRPQVTIFGVESLFPTVELKGILESAFTDSRVARQH